MPRTRSHHARVRRWPLLTAGTAVLVVVVLAILIVPSFRPPPVAIDGVGFTEEEVALARERAERDGRADPESDGAIEVLRDDQALFAVARRVGASDVVRPSDILGIVDEVNADRAAIAADGGILYGPVEYDPRSFYGKSLTDIRQAVVQRLESGVGVVPVTDADVRELFDRDVDQWADAATTYRLTVATLTGSPEKPVDAVRAQDLAAVGWASISAQASLADLTVTTEELQAGAMSPNVAASLAGASEGDVIGPENVHGIWVFYRLDGETVDRERALEHYSSRIRASLYEERLDALLAEERAAQTVSSR